MTNSIFLENKYTKWYYSIINNANTRQLPPTVYVEKHHIIPRSIGGSNDISNIAILTGKEHFVCHLLLTKMLVGKSYHKMIFALSMMANTRPDKIKYNASTYHLNKLVVIVIFLDIPKIITFPLIIENGGRIPASMRFQAIKLCCDFVEFLRF